MTRSGELTERIVARIRDEGPITFHAFMEMALYYPHLGYYTSGARRIGKAGDYFTNVSVSRVFGELLADYFVKTWQRIGKGPFTIIEMGSERGILSKDIKSYIARRHPDFSEVLDFHALERGNSIPAIENGIYFSNELVDAFPVHRVRMTKDGLKEIYVNFSQSGFDETLAEPSTPEIERYFKELDIELPVGYVAEVNLDAVRWIEHIAASLKRGIVLTIDYGYESPELYAPRRADGTLLAYRKHTVEHNLYVDIGEQDLTSHVNFSALMQWGEDAGLATKSFTDQTKFFMQLDLDAKLREMRAEISDDVEFQKAQLALKHLILPEGMGSTFKVLVQQKGFLPV